MKIITWNVNGLRAHLKKDAWKWSAAQKADAICYQEIKARPDQLTKAQHALFEGYEAAWNPAYVITCEDRYQCANNVNNANNILFIKYRCMRLFWFL